MKLSRKIYAVIAALVCVFTLCFALACDDSDSSSALNNIEGPTFVYVTGEQTFVVEGSTSVMGDEAAQFKSTIKTSDIVLSGALSGMTVKGVNYVSQSEIEITISGNAAAFDGDKAEGKITVKGSATANGKDSYCIVWVNKPTMYVSGIMSSVSSSKNKYVVTISLPYGSFTDSATAEHIRLSDPANGTISSITVTEEGKLKIQITDYVKAESTSCPTLIMDACVTTFDVEISIQVKTGATAKLYK
ncbi:MAG: hypothetical protein ACI4L9_04900 [Candidatus Coproplasma sp.]